MRRRLYGSPLGLNRGEGQMTVENPSHLRFVRVLIATKNVGSTSTTSDIMVDHSGLVY